MGLLGVGLGQARVHAAPGSLGLHHGAPGAHDHVDGRERARQDDAGCDDAAGRELLLKKERSPRAEDEDLEDLAHGARGRREHAVPTRGAHRVGLGLGVDAPPSRIGAVHQAHGDQGGTLARQSVRETPGLKSGGAGFLR